MVGAAIPSVPNAVLHDLYAGAPADSVIAADFADALYRTARTERPNVVVEIGMANGASTLAILTALEENGAGRLLSVDPYQRRTWLGAGVDRVDASGLAHRHELIEEPDYLALPELLRAGTTVDLAYVDGWHTFDYTLLDFFYLDRMLRVGGVVGFNDCHYPAVDKVLSFVVGHRRYASEDVGLKRRPAVRRRWRLPLGRLTGHRLDGADQYFRKLEEWEPPYTFWRDL